MLGLGSELQASSEGVIAARDNLPVTRLVRRSMSINIAPYRRTLRPVYRTIARVCRDEALAYRRSILTRTGQPVSVRMCSANTGGVHVHEQGERAHAGVAVKRVPVDDQCSWSTLARLSGALASPWRRLLGAKLRDTSRSQVGPTTLRASAVGLSRPTEGGSRRRGVVVSF